VALAAPAVLPAQTVMQVQGGGSSLTGGYGATANIWRNGVDGWLGIGWLDGLRVGAFIRSAVGRDTLRLGNDVLSLRYPTDIFGGELNLLVQGASWQHATRSGSVVAFGGGSAAGLSSPSFAAWKAQAPMGALMLERRLAPDLRFTTTAVVAARQTVVSGLQWQATPDVTAAVSGGLGGGRPYGASSLLLTRGRVTLRAAYVYNPDRFRRAEVPAPLQTQLDRENISLTYQLAPEVSVGVARQNYVQDSADVAVPLRASGNSAFLGGRLGEFRVSAGVYDSRSDSLRNVSSYVAAGRRVTSWLDAELFVLQSRPQGRASTTTPVLNLRERISPRVGLMQQLTTDQGAVRMLLGGSLVTALGEFGVDYSIVHQPFQPLQPFRSALSLTARLQLGRYSTSFATFVRPDGQVDYAASGGTFLYMGQFGLQPQQIGGPGSIARYVFRGRVLDVEGAPVEGAAVELNGQTTFTNSRGEFSLRVRHPDRAHPAVALDEFLLPGRWSVARLPDQVTAQPEERASGFDIILRRALPAAPAQPVEAPPAPPAAEPSDTLRPLPAPRVDDPPASPAPAPPPAPLFREHESVVVLEGLFFAPSEAVVEQRSLPALAQLAAQLRADTTLRIEIAGHTDASGRARTNVILSQARAEAVRAYLVQQGIAPGRMTARGYGASRPVASNATADGRAQNRRVELRRRTPAEASDSAARAGAVRPGSIACRANASRPCPAPRRPRRRSRARPADSPAPRARVPSPPAAPAGPSPSRS
jgi:outer membrane protein OmpA-like peptidoglycan-associated protein